jgi:hypothetical protein
MYAIISHRKSMGFLVAYLKEESHFVLMINITKIFLVANDENQMYQESVR